MNLTARLRTRVTAPLTRFAPAPTGLLHLGHIVNAIHVWGLAAATGGKVLLRIEDHDRQRCSPEHERALLEDLAWLGFAPDVAPIVRQSERDAIYRDALAPLCAGGSVYGCRCSRADIERALGVRATGDELRYPGTCRDLGLPLTDGVGWRLRIEPGTESFDDPLAGALTQDPAAQCGDLLLRDRLGNWTYQAAATIDDTVGGIDLIVRGRDLLESTGRQLRLARRLGRLELPVFVHHGLVMKGPTQKLSKSDGDTGIRALREAGWSAARVIGHAAALAGLQPGPKPIDAAAVSSLFAPLPA